MIVTADPIDSMTWGEDRFGCMKGATVKGGFFALAQAELGINIGNLLPQSYEAPTFRLSSYAVRRRRAMIVSIRVELKEKSQP